MGGVRRARCSRFRLCPTHTKVSSESWFSLSSLVCCDNSQSRVNLSMRFLLPPAFHAIYFVPTRLPFQAGEIYSCLMSREICESPNFNIFSWSQVPPLRESTGPAAAAALALSLKLLSSFSSSCREDSSELLSSGAQQWTKQILNVEKLVQYNVKCNVK